MATKVYRPTSPGRRNMSVNKRDAVTAERPHRPLVSKVSSPQGRNNNGRITSRFRGGGHKRLYRQIDFRRDKHGVPGKVATVEYDPNRTAFIALIHYADGEKRYILAPEGLKVNDTVIAASDAFQLDSAHPETDSLDPRGLTDAARDARLLSVIAIGTRGDARHLDQTLDRLTDKATDRA